MRTGHDFHRVALLEQPSPLGPVSEPPPHGSARIVDFQPDSIRMETDAAAPALLVLAEAFYPGWTAGIDDGPPTPCLPVNAWMRAVPIPAGRHTVNMRFHSRYLPAGAGLSIVSLLAALVVFYWSSRKVRHVQAEQP